MFVNFQYELVPILIGGSEKHIPGDLARLHRTGMFTQLWKTVLNGLFQVEMLVQ